jgi:hypothetical protein
MAGFISLDPGSSRSRTPFEWFAPRSRLAAALRPYGTNREIGSRPQSALPHPVGCRIDRIRHVDPRAILAVFRIGAERIDGLQFGRVGCRIRLENAALLLSRLLFGFDLGPDFAKKPFRLGVHRPRRFNEFHERMQSSFGVPVSQYWRYRERVGGPGVEPDGRHDHTSESECPADNQGSSGYNSRFE